MLSAIQLRKHDFAEISIVANQSITDEATVETAVTCHHQFRASPIDDQLTSWIARLRLELIQPEDNRVASYTGAIEVFGEFEMHPDLPETDRSKHANINGGAMLYAAAREMVTLLTSRSMHGVVELPTIDPRAFLPKDNEETQEPN
jgi:preprotein translocase subunit SecB